MWLKTFTPFLIVSPMSNLKTNRVLCLLQRVLPTGMRTIFLTSVFVTFFLAFFSSEIDINCAASIFLLWFLTAKKSHEFPSFQTQTLFRPVSHCEIHSSPTQLTIPSHWFLRLLDTLLSHKLRISLTLGLFPTKLINRTLLLLKRSPDEGKGMSVSIQTFTSQSVGIFDLERSPRPLLHSSKFPDFRVVANDFKFGWIGTFFRRRKSVGKIVHLQNCCLSISQTVQILVHRTFSRVTKQVFPAYTILTHRNRSLIELKQNFFCFENLQRFTVVRSKIPLKKSTFQVRNVRWRVWGC